MCPTRATASSISLAGAVDIARTGDLWIFRGHTAADQVIRTMTQAPVNHVGVSLVLDDLPPLLWHAELGRGLTDLWTGTAHRGVQLHDLRDAVQRWMTTYGQDGWLRQLTPAVDRDAEDAALRMVARLDGVAFPSTGRLAWRWLAGRDAHLSPRRQLAKLGRPEVAYCAEVVALTLEEMGVLDGGAPANWYDPGRFWSGDRLPLRAPFAYGREVRIIRSGELKPPSYRK